MIDKQLQKKYFINYSIIDKLIARQIWLTAKGCENENLETRFADK